MQIYRIHIKSWITQIVRIINVLFSVFSFQLCILLLIGACTKADVQYIPAKDSLGAVCIYPDMSEYILPTQKYYFYNTNGVTPCQTLPCDGYGNFSGTLPCSSYRVIASNASTTGAIYKNMDDYETAMVYADNLYTRSSFSRISRPSDIVLLGKVYRIALEKLDVSLNDTVRHTPSPSLLTRTVMLDFSLSDELVEQVTALTGTLPGVYPSVQLSTGKTIDSEIIRAPDLLMDYVASKQDDGWRASVNLFGICDPKHGDAYRNISAVTLTTIVSTHEVEIDLTDGLSAIIENYNGALPIDIPVQLNIELELVDIGVLGTVKSWGYIDDSGTEIPIPF